jgi:hypothetical protein
LRRARWRLATLHGGHRSLGQRSTWSDGQGHAGVAPRAGSDCLDNDVLLCSDATGIALDSAVAGEPSVVDRGHTPSGAVGKASTSSTAERI